MRNPWVVPIVLGIMAVLGGTAATIPLGAPASAAPGQAAGGGRCGPAEYPPTPVGVQISTSVVIAGATVTVTGEGFAPDVTVLVELEPGSSVLGRVVPDSSGRFRTTVTIPATTTPGSYEIVATGGCQGDPTQIRHLTAHITVTSGASGPAPAPAPSNTGPLAITGIESLLTVVASLTLILVGSAIVLVTRRRRSTRQTPTYPGGRI